MEARVLPLEEFDDLDAFMDWCQHFVEVVIGTWTEPDDDFEPTFVAVNATDIVVFELQVSGLNIDAAKNTLGKQVFPELVRTTDAKRFAWISSAWWMPSEDPRKVERYKAWRAEQVAKGNSSLEGGPGVIEAVQIMAGEWTGDQMVMMAQLHRRKRKPPRFAWVELARGEGLRSRGHWPDVERSFGGRLIDDVMRAITGYPTRLEYADIVRRISRQPELQERLAAMFVEAGVDLGEYMSLRELEESAMDDEQREVVKARVAEFEERVKAAMDEGTKDLLQSLWDEHVSPSGRPRDPEESA